MSPARVLHTISLCSAWARGDAEAAEVLLRSAEPDLVADLLEFVTFVIRENTEGQAVLYLEFLAQQARALQAAEAD
jgi:hypothetical protein